LGTILSYFFKLKCTKAPAIALASLLLLSSCLGTKSLKEGEYLLYQQSIEGTENVNAINLSDLLRQKPNPRIPLLPISIPAWSYHVGSGSFDSSKVGDKIRDTEQYYAKKVAETDDNNRKLAKIERKRDNKLERLNTKKTEGNFLMRRGEAPAVWDSLLAEASVDQMKFYLFSNGYFNAAVDYEYEKKGRLIYETYTVYEGTPYTLDSIFYKIPDPKVYSLIRENDNNRLINQGDRYVQDNFGKERDRIEDILKNNGYFDFSRQLIDYNIDSTARNYTLAVEISVRNPPRQDNHKIFEIDSVFFTTDANANRPGMRSTYYLNGVTFQYFDRKYNERILENRVRIKPGELYSRANTVQTQRQLFNLELFQFANVVYDTTGGKMVTNIYTSPLPKWQISVETGLNVTQGYPGPMFSFNVKDRNIMKTLGILDFNGRFSVEGVAGAATEKGLYRSVEYGGNLGLTLPGIVIPYGRRLVRRIGSYNPRTRTSLGFNYIDRPEYFRSNANFTFGYNWITPKNHSFNINFTDINILDSRIKSQDFADRLLELQEAGNNLIFSFRRSFSSGVTGQAIFNFNEYGNKVRKSSLVRVYGESTGTFLGLYKNFITDNLNLFPFQFLKGQAEYRSHVPLNRNTQFAWRVNTGFAYAYGESDVLPYEKFFFAGGSNSIRAWAPRRLGPGSFVYRDANGQPDYRFEQPGEILLEMSAEIRTKLFSFVQGALFVDAGNVWYSRSEPVPGGKFEAKDFVQEIAIGSGVGLRLDFSFLVLRFDAGIKTYDPAQVRGERWVIRNLRWDKPFGERNQTVLNIAIGYPF
jgi:outer membrane protein insertion porin family